MADLIPGTGLLEYNLNLMRTEADGTISDLPEPAPDPTTGPLTDEEIADIRAWRNEVRNRFNPPAE